MVAADAASTRDAIKVLYEEVYVQSMVAAVAVAVSTRDVGKSMYEEVFVERMVAADAVSTMDVIKVLKKKVFVGNTSNTYLTCII